MGRVVHKDIEALQQRALNVDGTTKCALTVKKKNNDKYFVKCFDYTFFYFISFFIF